MPPSPTLPEPFRYRHDGWSPARQAEFVATLARTGCVRDACRAVGISSTSAYRARRRMPDFAEQWDLALRRAAVSLEAVAWQRAVEGVDEPIVSGGKVIGTRKRHSDALLRLLIQRGDLRAREEAAAAEVAAAAAAPVSPEKSAKYRLVNEILRLRARHHEINDLPPDPPEWVEKIRRNLAIEHGQPWPPPDRQGLQ